MNIWTIDDALSHGPCSDYTRNRLIELWAGREFLTALDICDLDIQPADRCWALARIMTPEQCTAWCERFFSRVVKTHALHCGIEAVEQWAARWLSGEDRTTAEAREAACEAARAAWVETWTAAEAAREAVARAAGAATRAARMEEVMWAVWAAAEAEGVRAEGKKKRRNTPASSTMRGPC